MWFVNLKSFLTTVGVLVCLSLLVCGLNNVGFTSLKEEKVLRGPAKKELFSDEAILKIISEPMPENLTLNIENVSEDSRICVEDKHEDNSQCGQSNDAVKISDVGHEKLNVTEATRDNAEYENNVLLDDIQKRKQSPEFFSPNHLFEMLPPFQLHKTRGVSTQCRKHSAIYVENLKQLQMWALRMYDSSTKIPSGFLNGNINQYGDIDECLRVRHQLPDGELLKGQYCLASLQLSLSANASGIIKDVFKLVHSHYAFRSTLSDPGHRVPRFSSVTWAVCVPSSCTPQDVQMTINDYVNIPTFDNQISTKVYVDPSMCQIQQDHKFSRGFIFVSLIFIFFIALSILGTLGETIYIGSIPEWICGFSLIRNMKSIFSIKPTSNNDEVKAVHGIRCLNAIMLLIAHKSMAIFFLPYINRTQMAELLGQPWSVLGRTASLYTDPFIMFSGLLTCYSLLGRHSRGQKINIASEYLCRLFRLVPTMSALILFCTWILPEMATGPQWPLVVTKHAQICKDNWWRNLLFIHNYFGFQNMCLTHTHHIGIDTQLFILGVPLSLWLVKSTSENLRRNVFILIFIATASTVGRFYISYVMKLANFVSYGSSVEQLFKTADYMYIIPAYRITVYIIGMLLALLLRNTTNYKLSQGQLKLGWIMAVSLFLGSLLLPTPMSYVNYKYNPLSAALYASLAPIGWVLSFGWIIYTQHLGYNSWLGSIFSWKIFAIWTKLSYAIYLTQFPVFFYFVGTTRSPQYYTVIGETINVKEILIIVVTSVILTLLFDLPFQNLRKILYKRFDKSTRTKKVNEAEKTENKSLYSKIMGAVSHTIAIVNTNMKQKSL